MAAEGEEKPAEATLKLVSAEGHIFIVHKKAAIISQTIKSMIEEGLFFVFFVFVFVCFVCLLLSWGGVSVRRWKGDFVLLFCWEIL